MMTDVEWQELVRQIREQAVSNMHLSLQKMVGLGADPKECFTALSCGAMLGICDFQLQHATKAEHSPEHVRTVILDLFTEHLDEAMKCHTASSSSPSTTASS